jgi:hypothetical protein
VYVGVGAKVIVQLCSTAVCKEWGMDVVQLCSTAVCKEWGMDGHMEEYVACSV